MIISRFHELRDFRKSHRAIVASSGGNSTSGWARAGETSTVEDLELATSFEFS